jgi:hypothetical protein
MLSINEWDPLKKVVVGRADHAQIPPLDPSHQAVNYANVQDLSSIPVGPYPQSVIDEANQDLELLVEVLQQNGVEVIRPDPNHKPGYYNYCPRDSFLVYKDTILVTPQPIRSRAMDYESLVLAIDYLKSHAGSRKITAVLSAGGDWRIEGRVDEVIWVGPCGQFDDVQDLIASGVLDKLENQGILIKGARRFGMERIVDRLKGLLHKTVMEINLDALKSNFMYFKKAVKPGVKLMVMVKAQGYGSGSTEVAKELQDLGVDYLGVAYADEGVSLREAGIHVPIMVLNVDAYTLEILDKYALEPVIYSVNNLNEYLNERSGRAGKIHLEIDTGMHRLGFEGPEIFEAMKNLRAHAQSFGEGIGGEGHNHKLLDIYGVIGM